MVSHVSESNAFKVLTLSRIAWVERDPDKLERLRTIFGLELTQLDDSVPVTLPTGSYFSRVTGVPKLKIKEMGSRYLFICLYIWLEKHLSRGDYKRPDNTG